MERDRACRAVRAIARRRGHVRSALAAGALLVAVVAFAAGALAGQRPRYGGELRRVTFAPLSAAEPASAASFEELELVRNVHATLLERRPDGSYVPGLAAGYEVIASRLVLTMRSGLRFHDGSPLRAAAARASLVALLEGAPSLSRLPGIPAPSAIRAPDELHLHIDLPSPDPRMLLDLLSEPLASITLPRPDGPSLGAGPWKVAERGATRLRLVPFLEHHEGRPYVEGLVIDSITAPAEQRRALESGAWDVIDLPAAIDASPGARVVLVDGEETISVRLDGKRSGWAQPAVLAGLRAVDRQAMVDVILKGRGAAAFSIVSPTLFPLVPRPAAPPATSGLAAGKPAAPLFYPSHDTDLALAAERLRFALRDVCTVEPRPLPLEEWRKQVGGGAGATLGATYVPARALPLALARAILGAEAVAVEAPSGDPAAVTAALLALPHTGRVDLFHRSRRLLVKEGLLGLPARSDGPPSYANVWRGLR